MPFNNILRYYGITTHTVKAEFFVDCQVDRADFPSRRVAFVGMTAFYLLVTCTGGLATCSVHKPAISGIAGYWASRADVVLYHLFVATGWRLLQYLFISAGSERSPR